VNISIARKQACDFDGTKTKTETFLKLISKETLHIMRGLRVICPLLHRNIDFKPKRMPQISSQIEVKYLTLDSNPESQHKYFNMKKEICTATKFVSSELIPEFSLHVITPDMEIWNQPFDQLSEDFRSSFWHSSMPYWAIFWPGGQILSRYILDFPDVVKSKRIVDIGAGSGAASLASLISGCEIVVANDIDEMSLGATIINAEANNLFDSQKLQVNNDNYLQGNIEENAKYLANHSDVLLVGDMYFDEEIGDKISILVSKYVLFNTDSKARTRKKVLIGDPGRWYLRDKNKKRDNLRCVAKYELTDEIKRHNYGLVQGIIYQVS